MLFNENKFHMLNYFTLYTDVNTLVVVPVLSHIVGDFKRVCGNIRSGGERGVTDNGERGQTRSKSVIFTPNCSQYHVDRSLVKY